MLEKIESWINRYELLNSGDFVLAACSGGPDSLALVHSLVRLRSKYKIRLAVAHVDHMLRGEDSEADAEFVAKFCRQLNLACYRTAVDVPGYIAETGRSLQDAARKLRYEYLRQTALGIGQAKIATGHHRDDQAETILINLLRGAGSTGLSGMKPYHAGIIRPLLGISRAEIEQYCQNQGLIPRQDSSNFKTDYLRNRIRLNLLPELEQNYNQAIKETLCRTAELIGGELDFIRQTLVDVWPQIVREEQDRFFVRRSGLAGLHIAQQREIIRLAIEKKQGSSRGITFVHVEKLIEMALTGRTGSVLELPGRLRARAGYDEVEVYRQAEPELSPPVAARRLNLPGKTYVPELHLTIVAELCTAVPEKLPPASAVFAWSELEPPLYIRTRRDGDRFRPKGFNGSKKVKDFFIDAKIPREKRAITPIIYDGKGILWVGGYRQAERGGIPVDTQQFLQLSLCTGEEHHD
ncbi:tRNA lysidine(34) synthetase TilS|uniref:tRNA(Ile)-lysidine synthase n=1 Tax=Dendrosporobacter quercicolus TaxID=146817 RepID=A0A1G9V0F3_9FIRM|nr:tRNA lysidine(34) synthetase TilS [Dendrosporobacter quercicolus]NSL47967.1 tRNA lysidine(34) synthetase TilS [Dendrosporobacter quercicolus DSM 1736]SDM65599.1 tRNA(Ile)-lysidine synthase [Dendrosporobacter quercicolus]